MNFFCLYIFARRIYYHLGIGIFFMNVSFEHPQPYFIFLFFVIAAFRSEKNLFRGFHFGKIEIRNYCTEVRGGIAFLEK